MMKLAIKKKSFPILRWFSLLRILVGILLTLHIFLYLRHSNILSHNNQGGEPFFLFLLVILTKLPVCSACEGACFLMKILQVVE